MSFWFCVLVVFMLVMMFFLIFWLVIMCNVVLVVLFFEVMCLCNIVVGLFDCVVSVVVFCMVLIVSWCFCLGVKFRLVVVCCRVLMNRKM